MRGAGWWWGPWGSVWLITSGTFSGMGTVSANGGGGANGYSNRDGGGGGGGRVAIYCSNNQFTGTVQSQGGRAFGGGGPGTRYINCGETVDELTIDNGEPSNNAPAHNTPIGIDGEIYINVTHLRLLNLAKVEFQSSGLGVGTAVTAEIGKLSGDATGTLDAIDESVVILSNMNLTHSPDNMDVSMLSISAHETVVTSRTKFYLNSLFNAASHIWVRAGGSLVTPPNLGLGRSIVMQVAGQLSGTESVVVGDGATLHLHETGYTQGQTANRWIFDDIVLEDGASLHSNAPLTADPGTAAVLSVNNGLRIGGENSDSTLSSLFVNGRLNVSADVLEITAAGEINGDGRGYAKNTGPGAFPHNGQGRGASHGGRGGGPTPYLAFGVDNGGPYGHYKYPASIGSGGRQGYHDYGGAGGAAVKLFASTSFNLSGTVSMGGKKPSSSSTGHNQYGSGGGAGGSIFILTSGVISGSGLVRANGGGGADGYSSRDGGGGGGGRVAIHCDSNNFQGTVQSQGGRSFGRGGPGTRYMDCGTIKDRLTVDNGPLPHNTPTHNTAIGLHGKQT